MRRYGIGSWRAAGFSVVELVVVSAVLSLSTLLLLPVIGTDRSALRERALNVFCQVRLRNLGVATMLYAQDYDGSLPLVDTVSIAHGSAQAAWSVYVLHRDYLGDAPVIPPNEWGDPGSVAFIGYTTGNQRPAPFVCPRALANPLRAAPNSPYPGATQYTFTPGVNTANFWVGSMPEPWLDLTVEMCQRAAARYDGRWFLWSDRVQPVPLHTNWEILPSSSHHHDAVEAPVGGHAVWLDGSVNWGGYPGYWKSDPTGVWRPWDAIWISAGHDGDGYAGLMVPPPRGAASLAITGFQCADPAARRTASQKLRALF